MTLQLIDPKTGVAQPAIGVYGKPITTPPVDGSAITPDNGTIYNPPISVTVWDATAQTIAIVPYGSKGDHIVTYPTKPGMLIPVLVSRVLLSGTTAAVIRGQLAYVASGEGSILGGLLMEGGGKILTEGSTPLELESGA
jgi:hypothetical protein